ncbi:hypothetical protein EON67_01325 [archaeon]|nr:MAG: hypothetical protein EON67_01325 [archaeon]
MSTCAQALTRGGRHTCPPGVQPELPAPRAFLMPHAGVRLRTPAPFPLAWARAAARRRRGSIRDTQNTRIPCMRAIEFVRTTCTYTRRVCPMPVAATFVMRRCAFAWGVGRGTVYPRPIHIAVGSPPASAGR